jgi:hypothetical protein
MLVQMGHAQFAPMGRSQMLLAQLAHHAHFKMQESLVFVNRALPALSQPTDRLHVNHAQ